MPRRSSTAKNRSRPHGKPEQEGLPPARSNNRVDLEYRKIGDLREPEGAPRKYSRSDLDKSKAIIRQQGIVVPLPVNRLGVVLSHYHIVVAARDLGFDELPVVVVDDLDNAQTKALSLGLTQLYQYGRFDQQLLGAWLTDIEFELPEFNFDALGFDQGEIERAMRSVEPDDEGSEEPVINLAEAAVSRIGDTWTCGKHRIGCGDAADHEWLKHVLGGAFAAMTFADPPYGCKVAGFVTTRAHREFVEGSEGRIDADLSALFTAWCKAIRNSCRPGALIYLCIDWRGLSALLAAAEAEFGDLINLIVWAKDRPGMGSLYRSQHELILLFRVPGASHQNNVQLGRHGRNRTNLWQYPAAVSFAKSGTEGDLLADHPTPKNKEMIADAIRDCTKRGEIVLDPFLGSGSTLIAAEKTGRIFCGSDLDPLYVDLAVRRWQAWTGQRAVHAETGELFNNRACVALDLSKSEGSNNE